jgi:hypothetical protein
MIHVHLTTPFFSVNIEEKLEIRKICAHKPRYFVLQQIGKNQNRTFATSWFDKKRSLAVSKENKPFFSIFCACLVKIIGL